MIDPFAFCFKDPEARARAMASGMVNAYKPALEDKYMNTTTPPSLATQVGGSHYKDYPIQPVEFCQRNRLGFCESSAIKYIVRHKNKHGKQDLENAIHFLQILIWLEYPDKHGAPSEKSQA